MKNDKSDIKNFNLKKVYLFLMLLFCLTIFVLAIPQFVQTNNGKSISEGSRSKGKLKNAFLMPYSGKNFSYFSWLSYFLMDNGYLNSKVHNTLISAYKICETTCPAIQFKVMECANKHGGKMSLHRTHQNGLSVDFMVPKIKNNKQHKIYDQLGLWHYLLNFTEDGKLTNNENISIDFETCAKHILALDEAAKQNGLAIRRVILKINLKDDLFKTESGKKLKQRGIYFAQALQPSVDNMHDDHYHIDFVER